MTKLYFINDGSGFNTGWCTSMREAKTVRASLIRASGSEYRDTEIEDYDVLKMSQAMLFSVAYSTRTPVQARRVAQRELDRRER